MGMQVKDNTFTWVIKNVSSSPQFVSEPFIVGGCVWQISANPKDIEAFDYKSLSLYLDVCGSESLPCGWKRHAKFSITIVNQLSEERSHLQETQQWFDEKTTGWGFPPMINLLDFSEEHDGFVLDDEVIIVAAVDVLEVIGPLDVNGFQVLPSQVKFVNSLFERNPDFASGFRAKDQSLKTSYENFLLNLTESLHQSPMVSYKEISSLHQSPTEFYKEVSSDAETTLVTMEDVGYKLDWLEDKIDEFEKEKEASEIRMQKIDKEFKDLKQKVSGLEALLNIACIFILLLVILLL